MNKKTGNSLGELGECEIVTTLKFVELYKKQRERNQKKAKKMLKVLITEKQRCGLGGEEHIVPKEWL